MTSLAVICARRLVKRYGDREVVRGIDLEVQPGQCFGLLGPNGAGKTTTIRMILGHSPITAGELRVFGLPMPAAAASVRARIGVVPQLDNLDPDFTVAENLRVYGSFFGIDQKLLAQRSLQLLQFAALSDRATSPIETLSGGMKRRLTIARALVNDPELLVLDEPTTGLDPQARHMIWSRLRDLKGQGKTLLLTSHYMEEAERLCDQLVIIDHGRILASGSPRQLIRQHVHPEVLELHGDAPRVHDAIVGCDDVRVETTGDTVYCYARDSRAIAERLRQVPGIEVLYRQANLEDVFLTITGRDLRE